MKCVRAISAATGLALGLCWAGGASAQIVAGILEPEPTPASPEGPDTRQVEGKVVDVQQSGRMMTVLKLDNGQALTLPETSRASAASPKVGDDIVAHFVDQDGSHIATFVRVMEVEAP